MILVLAIALIFAAFINILALRRRTKRLQIFDKIETKNLSLSALVESQLAQQKQTFWQKMVFDTKQTIKSYFNLLMIGQSKVTLCGYLFVGIAAGMIFNNYYIGINRYLAIVLSFAISILAILYIKKRKLAKEFYETFPEALGTIAGVVSSGYAITTSFKTCGDSISGVVGSTMKEIHNRMEVGESIESVLLSSYRQLPFQEYYFFILTVMVNLDSGGELKEVLNRLSKMLTNNRILNKTRDSKTAELRMTMIILACIPFGFILLLKVSSPMHYDYLVGTTVGHYILYYVVSSVAIGIFFIKNMISKII
ncbi:type II secretion system F family protein [Orbus sasakiae]|uniref:Type II secretion system F family protein n=1 Tax=Orbus sasakiae TaxID=1078475 RepID=A0ABP9NEI9_9GAMM